MQVEIIPLSTGCLGSCTYCKTRHARGKLGSYHPDAIVSRARSVLTERAGLVSRLATLTTAGAATATAASPATVATAVSAGVKEGKHSSAAEPMTLHVRKGGGGRVGT